MTIIEYYKSLLGYDNIPEFLKEYLNVPSLNRIKGVSYFCGMDYASKEIYDFGEYITRFDHSMKVSYYSYKVAKLLHLDYRQTARGGLLHDFFLSPEVRSKKERFVSFINKVVVSNLSIGEQTSKDSLLRRIKKVNTLTLRK